MTRASKPTEELLAAFMEGYCAGKYDLANDIKRAVSGSLPTNTDKAHPSVSQAAAKWLRGYAKEASE